MARFAPLLLVTWLLLPSSSVLSQTPLTHAPDGDSSMNTTAPIAVLPIPNAPFSATANTEETTTFPWGTTRTTTNHRLIARDGRGRVFQERRMIAPPGSPAESQLTRTEIADPTTRTLAFCDSNQSVCELRAYRVVTNWVLPPAGPSPDGKSSLTRESLGTQTVDGFFEIIGTRETLSLALDSDRPISVTKEFWYSPRLGLNISTKRWDPRISRVETLTVTDINLAEPDPNLFALPANTRIVDYRTPTGPR